MLRLTIICWIRIKITKNQQDNGYIIPMIYFFYKTTNKVNGRYYYGVHSTENIDDGYLGSGRALKAAVKKYGVENFEREILVFCSSERAMYMYEAEVVTQEVVNDPMSYNMALGGDGGSIHSEEVLKHLSEVNRGERNPMYGKPGANKGKHFSEETKKKMKESALGKHSGELNGMYGKKHSFSSRKRMSEFSLGQIAWNKGIPCSEETKRKISEKKKGRHWRLDPETNKRIYY